MIAEFAEDGISFRYPREWRLEREDSDTGWTISVQSPETAFLLLTLREDMPTMEEVAEAALKALKEDYPDLESEEITETLGGQPALGHDIQFFSFDLLNTCWTRSFYSLYGTALLLCQTSDLELEKNGAILKAICASLKVEEEE